MIKKILSANAIKNHCYFFFVFQNYVTEVLSLHFKKTNA